MLRRMKRSLIDGAARLIWTKFFHATVGDGVQFYGFPPRVSAPGLLIIEDGVVFRGGRVRSYLEVRQGAEIRIGSRTFVNGGVEIQAAVSVTIGAGCLIGDEVIIQDSAFHEVDEGGRPKVEPVAIGNNVWIARRAIILPGVNVGDHSVIGAGSVVTKDVPAKTVYAGTPAKFVRNVEASDAFQR